MKPPTLERETEERPSLEKIIIVIKKSLQAKGFSHNIWRNGGSKICFLIAKGENKVWVFNVYVYLFSSMERERCEVRPDRDIRGSVPSCCTGLWFLSRFHLLISGLHKPVSGF